MRGRSSSSRASSSTSSSPRLLFAIIFAAYGAPSDKEIVRIGDVVAGTPAQAAGWQPGDQFVRVGGQTITAQRDLSDAIAAAAGKPVQVDLLRNGQTVTTTITPRTPDQTPAGQGATGITRLRASYRRARTGLARDPAWLRRDVPGHR